MKIRENSGPFVCMVANQWASDREFDIHEPIMKPGSGIGMRPISRRTVGTHVDFIKRGK